MKKKKKLKNRIGAFVCALVVAVSCLGASVPYYAYTDEDTAFLMVQEYLISEPYIDLGFEVLKAQYLSDYPYYVIFNGYYNIEDSSQGFSETFIVFTEEPLLVETYNGSWSNNFGTKYTTRCLRLVEPTCGVVYANSQKIGGNITVELTIKNEWIDTSYKRICAYKDESLKYLYTSFCESNYDLVHKDSGDVFFYGNALNNNSSNYNYNLGYLQNVYEYKSYLEVPLGEVVNDKFSARWYFDNLTTTGIDLSSGNYTIRYYQERWLVSGYDLEDDVVEKSDRYLIGEYSANQRYIETNSEDIDLRLESLGYEEPGFFDLLWHKFVNTHHYFQVVDNDSGEVGGYLHIYYTDETGTFGAEYIGETVDENGDFDENGYKQVVNDESITSDSYEEGFDTLESGSNTDFGDIDGVNEFSSILTNYANGVANFGNALGVFLSAFPSWLLISVGIGVCLIVFCIVFKVLTR